MAMFSFKKCEEYFVAVWCTVMPITGFVVIPAVQGTIPAYLLALTSLAFVFFKIRSGEVDERFVRYVKTFVAIFLLWLVLLVGSQVSSLIGGRHDFGDIGLIDPTATTTILLRTTLFTQSLYLLACVLTALYFRYFFREEWLKYVYWGGYFVAGYGIYEWSYFLVFNKTGDFLANRMFGDHPGSWSQTLPVGPFRLLRIKSTLGEPTFFAAVVLPYFYLALDRRKFVLSGMLLFAAIFSISTACYITLGFTLFIKSFWTRKLRLDYLAILFLVGCFLGGVAFFLPDLFRSMFEDKISGNNESGALRVASSQAMYNLIDSFSLPTWIFGIGFGYAYLDIYHGLFINTGLLGLGAFLFVFGRALFQLPVIPGYEGMKAGLLAIMVLCGLSLSELFLPPTWMFIGLAYFKLEQYRLSRLAVRPSVPEMSSLSPARPQPQVRS